MRRIKMTVLTRLLVLHLLLAVLIACINAPPAKSTTAASRVSSPRSTGGSVQAQAVKAEADACPVTDAVWAKPPDDAAVQGSSAFGYYFVNDDRSIWASAWWAGQTDNPLQVREEGIKVGWFRPAGATLQITGQRIDAQGAPLEAHVPCCYPTRFQATGLFFPSAGCWTVKAKADERELSFVVWVEP
jgi:hypothetical protein